MATVDPIRFYEGKLEYGILIAEVLGAESAPLHGSEEGNSYFVTLWSCLGDSENPFWIPLRLVDVISVGPSVEQLFSSEFVVIRKSEDAFQEVLGLWCVL